MRRQTYRDGWIPGYIYAMVKSKPRQDLYQPAIALDRNRPPRGDGAHPGKEETACPLNPSRPRGRSCAFGPIGRSRDGSSQAPWHGSRSSTLASGFVLVAGGNLDPGEIESRLGLAAGAAIGPFGQVFGGWEPVALARAGGAERALGVGRRGDADDRCRPLAFGDRRGCSSA